VKVEKNSKAKVKKNRKSKAPEQLEKRITYLLYNGFASDIVKQAKGRSENERS